MQKVRGGGSSTGRPTPLGQLASGADEFADDDRGVSFYTEAPDVEVCVREFEELTCDRLKVLHTFDRMCAYSTELPQDLSKIKTEISNAKLDLVNLAPGKESQYPAMKAEFRRRDSISHFALRIAFCK